MSIEVDEAEHSLEMHLPYICKMLSRNFSAGSFPPLVPILVGSTSPEVEKEYGKLLAPYLADPSNVFIISSDFCHWGSRFSYTYYITDADPSSGYSLTRTSRPPSDDTPIHESIRTLDELTMNMIATGLHDMFLSTIEETGNTVCGRHPIGVVMAAMEKLGTGNKVGEKERKGRFKFVRYERSSQCMKLSDSSVSYVSAFAVL
jgi:AmmeMemoRadiSam system protein B